MELTRKQFSQLLEALGDDVSLTNKIADIIEGWEEVGVYKVQRQAEVYRQPEPAEEKRTPARMSMGGIRDEDGTLMSGIL